MKLNKDKLRVAEVIFSQNSVKTYSYLTYDEDIKVGDFVVVDSRTGMSVGKVAHMRDPLPLGEYANRFVIQAISLWPLRQSMRYAEGNTRELPLPFPLTDIASIMNIETITAIEIMTMLRVFEHKLCCFYGDIDGPCDAIISDVRQIFKEIDDEYGIEYDSKHEIYLPRRTQNG